MEKKKFIIIFLVALVTNLYFPILTFAETILQDKQPASLTLESFADNVMSKLKNADFESLFNDFYIPKAYSNEDIQDDKEALTSGLKELIQNKLGLPESFSRINTVTEQLNTLTFAPGTPETVVNLPAQNLFYKVIFREFGDGYINFVIYKDGEKLSLKNIEVGLPSSNSKSAGIVLDFGRFMMGIVAEQQKKSLPVSR